MKRSYIPYVGLILTITYFFNHLSAGAQTTSVDKIYKKDNTVLSVKIIEVSDAIIKYKKSNYLDGPTYSVNKSEIATIQYANGDSEVIATSTSTPPPLTSTTSSNRSNSASAQSTNNNSSRSNNQRNSSQSSGGSLLGVILESTVDAITGNYSESGTSIRFKNVSGYTIEHFYLSPASRSNWGQDWLGEYVLRNNETITIKVNCGTYDVRTVDSDGLECIKYNFRICSSTFWELDECD